VTLEAALPASIREVGLESLMASQEPLATSTDTSGTKSAKIISAAARSPAPAVASASSSTAVEGLLVRWFQALQPDDRAGRFKGSPTLGATRQTPVRPQTCCYHRGSSAGGRIPACPPLRPLAVDDRSRQMETRTT
jgi:hypothetical protein